MNIITKPYAFILFLALIITAPQAYSLNCLRRIIPTRIMQWCAYSPKSLKWDSLEKNPDYPAQGSNFPSNFIWGAGTSAYQVDGERFTQSTYAAWSKKHPSYKERAGKACDHWNHYKEDIALMRNQLGLTAYRFSIEWSAIEPQEGVFDQEALNHYAQLYLELIRNNIRPIIGFHHYSDPQWFLDKGGFEYTKNIHLFVRFCTKVHQALTRTYPLDQIPKHLIPFWITFNSPASYAVNGYLTGERPPGKKSMPTTITVLKNMLEAHVQVYATLKKVSNLTCIGITHNIYQLDPKNRYNPLQRIKAYFGNTLVHENVYEFFTTGNLHYTNPFRALWNHTNKQAPKSLDFIGLNYYGHGIVSTSKIAPDPREIPTDNPRYTIYPTGMYRAIEEVSNKLAKPLNIPILITENGIGTTDDAKRDLYLKNYLYVILKAIKKGHTVIGYCYWSFMDNWEWGTYAIGYGLVAVDRKTLARTLRPSADYYINIIKEHRQTYTYPSILQ